MDATVSTQQIPRQHWPECFADLTEQYRGWRVSVEVLRLDIGDQWVLEGLPLIGMYVQQRGPHAGNIIIEAGDPSRELILHHVLYPVGVRLAMTEIGGEADVQIVSEDGTVTLARLRSSPELPAGPGAHHQGQRSRGRTSFAYEAESQSHATPTPVQAGASPFRRIAPAAASLRGQFAGRGVLDAYAGVPAFARGGTAGSGWPYILRGAAAILFGILAVMVPGIALLTLIFLFGVYALSDGIFNLAAALSYRGVARLQPRWVLLVKAIVSIAAGLVALLAPGITSVALLYVIAAWAIVTGVMEIAAAIALRRQMVGEWLLGLGGLLSVVVGVLLALYPGAGALGLLLWIAAYAVVFGVIEVSHGLMISDRLRHLERSAPLHAA